MVSFVRPFLVRIVVVWLTNITGEVHVSVEAEFRSAVNRHLKPLRNDLILVLEKLIAHNYPAEVELLAFEVFSDCFWQNFPVRVFFMDSSNNEFFIEKDGEAAYPSPVDPGLLDIKYVYPRELEESFGQRDATLDVCSAAATELIAWFIGCWKAAGGERFTRKATIAIHDHPDYYDLMEDSWRSF